MFFPIKLKKWDICVNDIFNGNHCMGQPGYFMIAGMNGQKFKFYVRCETLNNQTTTEKLFLYLAFEKKESVEKLWNSYTDFKVTFIMNNKSYTFGKVVLNGRFTERFPLVLKQNILKNNYLSSDNLTLPLFIEGIIFFERKLF